MSGRTGAGRTGAGRTEKIHKLLAITGRFSRRAAEQLVAEGRVLVNGRQAVVGQRLNGTERITVDSRPIRLTKQSGLLKVLIYNKPEGLVCSRRDPLGRPVVFEDLPGTGKGRWVMVGRLDINSSGLLLFTNQGEFANSLMHPSACIDREYVVRVRGAVDQQMLKRLCDGVLLEDGWANFSDIRAGGDGGTNRWFYVVIQRGRNREVRRLWESQRVQVSRLKRVRFGNVFLPSSLRQGQWRELPASQLTDLKKLVATDI